MASLARLGSAREFYRRTVGEQENSHIKTVSVKDWVRPMTENSGQKFLSFLVSLFPIVSWLPNYFHKDVFAPWLKRDVVVGLTVGLVLIPQSMSYAQAATLPPQFGLYSGFICSLVYPFFATSKDVVVGPVAVMALLTDNVLIAVNNVYPGVWSKPVIVTAYAMYCALIILVVAVFKLGWVVRLIPDSSITGFMTASSTNIATRQLPTFLGIRGIDTTLSVGLILVSLSKNIRDVHLDVVWGLSSFVALYIIRYGCEFLSKKLPNIASIFSFINILRNVLVLLFSTVASWAYCRGKMTPDGHYPIKVLKNIPSGLHYLQIPDTDPKLFLVLLPFLPVTVIVIVVQHMAASKSFARRNRYKVVPSQELFALGFVNGIASFFGAYPPSAFFTCSALKAMLKVSTPLAGIITSFVVFLAVYFATSAFYWISAAALAAIIIQAVLNLITPPSEVLSYWRLSPTDLVIWLSAVLGTIFFSISVGTYVSIGLSLFFLLYRISHTTGHFLGRATIYTDGPDGRAEHVSWMPLDGNGVSNPNAEVVPPLRGVIVYQFGDNLVYLNSSRFNAQIVSQVKETVRSGRDTSNLKASDRLWNEPRLDLSDDSSSQEDQKDDLFVVVLDFSRLVDFTGVRAIKDTRDELEKWVGHTVEFYFAGITEEWVLRAIVRGGFGVRRNIDEEEVESGTPLLFSDLDSAVLAAESFAVNEKHRKTSGPPSADGFEDIDTTFLFTPIARFYRWLWR